MLIVEALNVTGGTGEDADGLSDYDCKVLINRSTIFSGMVVGHIRRERKQARRTIRKLTQVSCCPECHSPRSERRPYYVKNDPNDKSETFTTENSHTCTNSWHWALSVKEGE